MYVHVYTTHTVYNLTTTHTHTHVHVHMVTYAQALTTVVRFFGAPLPLHFTYKVTSPLMLYVKTTSLSPMLHLSWALLLEILGEQDLPRDLIIVTGLKDLLCSLILSVRNG